MLLLSKLQSFESGEQHRKNGQKEPVAEGQLCDSLSVINTKITVVDVADI